MEICAANLGSKPQAGIPPAPLGQLTWPDGFQPAPLALQYRKANNFILSETAAVNQHRQEMGKN
jgi:hypothetical protein